MGQNILLAEEDAQLVAMLKSLLESRGYSTTHAPTGREALASIDADKPDMVIVGEQIGDIDGIGLIIKIRKQSSDLKVTYIASEWREAELYRQLTKDYKVGLIVQRPLKPTLFASQIDSQIKNIERKLTSAAEQEEKSFLTLRARFTEVLPQRLRLVKEAIDKAQAGETDKHLTGEARRLAHNLRGTSSSCGFDLVSEAAAHLERALIDALAVDPDAAAWQNIELLYTVLSKQGKLDLERNAPTEKQLRVLADDSFMAKVMLVGSEALFESKDSLKNGMPIKIIAAKSSAEALEIAANTPLDAVLIDMGSSKEGSAELAMSLRGIAGYESLPLAFIANGSGDNDRIASTHAGASLFLDKPVHPDKLREGIEYLLGISQGGRSRVLVVDDDEDFSGLISLALGKEGMLVRILNNPAGVLNVMEDFMPELVILDVMMPGISGFEVCRTLRATTRWQDTPILFLTAETELEARLAAFDAGGDDYLPKPVAPVELITRVRVRLERSRMIKERADRDILTTLLLRRAFMEQLDALIAESQRYELSFTVALLDVDHFKKVNDTYGHLAGDRVLAHLGQLLKRRFRVEDLRGRWGGEEFIVAFRHVTKDTCLGALTRVLEEIRETDFKGDHGEVFNISFTAGLSEFPQDGVTIESLVHVADQKLYVGKGLGRNTIISD